MRFPLSPWWWCHSVVRGVCGVVSQCQGQGQTNGGLSGSGDHYLDWGAFSHRLFSQAPSKEKGEEKGPQYKTKQRDEMM